VSQFGGRAAKDERFPEESERSSERLERELWLDPDAKGPRGRARIAREAASGTRRREEKE
jgi:hypothetical protein